MSSLVPYGWDEDWAAAFAPYAAQGLLPGRVVRVDRGSCDLVVTEEGVIRADTTYVTPHDPLRVICTGDWAAVDAPGARDDAVAGDHLPPMLGPGAWHILPDPRRLPEVLTTAATHGVPVSRLSARATRCEECGGPLV